MKAPSDEIYDKSTLGACIGYNSVAIFIRLDVVASQICEIPRNSTKIRTYSSSRSSKVTDLGVNRKRICNFLLVINSNYGRISYRNQDIDALSSKIARFSTPPLLDAPPSGGTPCNINVIYIALKSTLCSKKNTHSHFLSYLHELFVDLNKNCSEYTQGSTDSDNVKIRYSLRSMT